MSRSWPLGCTHCLGPTQQGRESSPTGACLPRCEHALLATKDSHPMGQVRWVDIKSPLSDASEPGLHADRSAKWHGRECVLDQPRQHEVRIDIDWTTPSAVSRRYFYQARLWKMQRTLIETHLRFRCDFRCWSRSAWSPGSLASLSGLLISTPSNLSIGMGIFVARRACSHLGRHGQSATTLGPAVSDLAMGAGPMANSVTWSLAA